MPEPDSGAQAEQFAGAMGDMAAPK